MLLCHTPSTNRSENPTPKPLFTQIPRQFQFTPWPYTCPWAFLNLLVASVGRIPRSLILDQLILQRPSRVFAIWPVEYHTVCTWIYRRPPVEKIEFVQNVQWPPPPNKYFTALFCNCPPFAGTSRRVQAGLGLGLGVQGQAELGLGVSVGQGRARGQRWPGSHGKASWLRSSLALLLKHTQSDTARTQHWPG